MTARVHGTSASLPSAVARTLVAPAPAYGPNCSGSVVDIPPANKPPKYIRTLKKRRQQQKNHLQIISTSQRRCRPAALLCTASVAHGSMRAFKWAASIALGNDPEGSPTSGITRGRAGSLPAGLQHHNRDRDATSNRTSSMQPSDDVDVRSGEAGGRTAGDW